MLVGVVGINYRSSCLEIREAVARAASKLFGIGGSYTKRYRSVLLSTCNRVEIYFSCKSLTEAASEIADAIRQESEAHFDVYCYMGQECFKHLSQVTAGLDSALVAETEIQSQVKKAYLTFKEKYVLSKDVHYLFQKALKVSKEVRSKLFIPKGAPSLEKTIFSLSHEILKKDLSEAKILFYGQSEINRRLINYLFKKGMKALSLCTHYKTDAVEEEMGAFEVRVFNWEECPCWCQYDVIIFGTSYESFILTQMPPHTACHLKTRVFFDLSVPRNVDPVLAKELHIPLYNIEDLTQLIASQRLSALQEIDQSQELLEDCVHRLYGIFHEKTNKGILCASSL